jgi:hypothetical protein
VVVVEVVEVVELVELVVTGIVDVIKGVEADEVVVVTGVDVVVVPIEVVEVLLFDVELDLSPPEHPARDKERTSITINETRINFLNSLNMFLLGL